MRIALAALRGNPASAAFYPRHDPRSTFAEMAVWWMRRDAVPTSLDTVYFQHRVYLPGPFRAGHSAYHHPASDFARLAVRAVEKHEAGHADFHWCFENAAVTTAAICLDDVEYLFASITIFGARWNLNYQVLRFPLLRVADFDVKVIVFAVSLALKSSE